MASLASYTALGHHDRAKISAALQSIIHGAGAHDRVALIQLLLDDIAEGRGRITQKDAAQALLAAKTLARVPEGAKAMGKPTNLRNLLKVLRTPGMPLDAQAEALRCVANTLLMVPPSRGEWITLGGGEVCVELLDKDSLAPEQYFPAARVVYLLTVERTPFILRLVEQLRIVDILAKRLDNLFDSYPISQVWLKESMTDLLKIAFNITLQYPRMLDDAPGGSTKILGETWDDKFALIVPTLLRFFHGLPVGSIPPAAPLTHVIHVLLNVPVSQFAALFFPSMANGSPNSSNGSHHTSESFSQRALSYLQRRSPYNGHGRRGSPVPSSDTLKRALDILDAALTHWFPSTDAGITEPDDPQVRRIATREDISVDELLSPLVLLIHRMISADYGAKERARATLFPPDLDRAIALEKRTDSLGRIVRLLTCVHFSRLKDAVGEMLYAMCDSDASTLSALVGYGNVAGFLFNKGIMAPPPPPTTSGPNGATINPITGSTAPMFDPDVEMTEEEKEAEAERLFILFDRLERTGMGVVNPVKQAAAEQRFHEIE